jgi:integrase
VITVWLVSNSGYWKAVWTIDGERKSRSIGSKAKFSRRQARVICREIGNEVEETSHLAGNAPKLSDWLKTYSESRDDVKRSTRRTYDEAGYYLRIFFDRDPTIDKITRGQAAEWKSLMSRGDLTQKLNESGMNGSHRAWRRLAPASVAKHVRAAKMIFKAAVDQDRILFNPFDRLTGNPPRVEKVWREVTPKEMVPILAACPNVGWKCLFGLCRFAGLRLGEAVRLEWRDVKIDENRMVINARLEVATTKQRERTTPIEPAKCPSGLTKLLQAAYKARGDAVQVCHGVPANNLRRDGLAILKRAGIERYAKPFHTLRKNCETAWAQVYPQGVVSDWIGHDITVSARHYLRVPEELYAKGKSEIGHSLDTSGRQNIPKLAAGQTPEPYLISGEE